MSSELAAAETKVCEGEEAIARLRRELEGTSTPEAQMDLKRLEKSRPVALSSAMVSSGTSPEMCTETQKS